MPGKLVDDVLPPGNDKGQQTSYARGLFSELGSIPSSPITLYPGVSILAKHGLCVLVLNQSRRDTRSSGPAEVWLLDTYIESKQTTSYI